MIKNQESSKSRIKLKFELKSALKNPEEGKEKGKPSAKSPIPHYNNKVVVNCNKMKMSLVSQRPKLLVKLSTFFYMLFILHVEASLVAQRPKILPIARDFAFSGKDSFSQFRSRSLSGTRSGA